MFSKIRQILLDVDAAPDFALVKDDLREDELERFRKVGENLKERLAMEQARAAGAAANGDEASEGMNATADPLVSLLGNTVHLASFHRSFVDHPVRCWLSEWHQAEFHREFPGTVQQFRGPAMQVARRQGFYTLNSRTEEQLLSGGGARTVWMLEQETKGDVVGETRPVVEELAVG